MTEIACGPRKLDTFVRLNGGIDVPESRFMFARPRSSNQRITTSTFSCDIAYSDNPAASRASAGSR